MCSGQRRSAGSAQVSGEQVPEMDGSMALMAMEEGAGTGEVVALAGARVMVQRSNYICQLVAIRAHEGSIKACMDACSIACKLS